MANDMNLPRLNDLSTLLITSDDLGKAKEAEFVRSIKADKVKMLSPTTRFPASCWHPKSTPHSWRSPTSS